MEGKVGVGGNGRGSGRGRGRGRGYGTTSNSQHPIKTSDMMLCCVYENKLHFVGKHESYSPKHSQRKEDFFPLLGKTFEVDPSARYVDSTQLQESPPASQLKEEEVIYAAGVLLLRKKDENYQILLGQNDTNSFIDFCYSLKDKINSSPEEFQKFVASIEKDNIYAMTFEEIERIKEVFEKSPVQLSSLNQLMTRDSGFDQALRNLKEEYRKLIFEMANRVDLTKVKPSKRHSILKGLKKGVEIPQNTAFREMKEELGFPKNNVLENLEELIRFVEPKIQTQESILVHYSENSGSHTRSRGMLQIFPILLPHENFEVMKSSFQEYKFAWHNLEEAIELMEPNQVAKIRTIPLLVQVNEIIAYQREIQILKRKILEKDKENRSISQELQKVNEQLMQSGFSSLEI